MASAGAQSLIHGGQGMQGMQGGAGVAGHGIGTNHMLAGHGQGGGLPGMDHAQLQQMAGMPYGLAYGNSAMHSNMAFFGGGGN